MKRNSPSSTPKPQTLSRQRFWQRHLIQWQGSGLSKAAYSQQHSLVYHQMVYWSGTASKDRADSHTAPGDFIPVTVTGESDNSVLSLHLPNGIAIEGIDERSVALVGKLIEQL